MAKIHVGMRVDEQLVERLKNAIWHTGRGLTISSVIEAALENVVARMKTPGDGYAFCRRQELQQAQRGASAVVFRQLPEPGRAHHRCLARQACLSEHLGDGLHLVFDNVVVCAEFALRLLDEIKQVNWEQFGLPDDTTVRMGIHAGPVYRHTDPIIQRANFFGSHVNRAARIEPITTPGCAFTSEQFAAALAVEPGHSFICEYMGLVDLAKDFGRFPLYRLGQR